MNIVLDEAVEEKDGGEKVKIGMVVCPPSLVISYFRRMCHPLTSQVIRGNSIVMLEALERIGGDDRRQHQER